MHLEITRQEDSASAHDSLLELRYLASIYICSHADHIGEKTACPLIDTPSLIMAPYHDGPTEHDCWQMFPQSTFYTWYGDASPRQPSVFF